MSDYPTEMAVEDAEMLMVGVDPRTSQVGHSGVDNDYIVNEMPDAKNASGRRQ
jgi:hypothetical protein